ncbi:MAG TPA: hypothetical protein ACFYEK_10910 [Candidatus Wunengus sp. YC60]|uniref:hypothetical protein n=1 Tax=Candidatus Wunengus sp. YC60 TaxID=3367697 RepID=UPI004029AA61
MANLSTVADMIEYVLYTSGQTTSSSDSFYNRAIEHINRARLELIKGVSPLDPTKRTTFKWAIKYPPYTLVLQPKITTTSVSVTNNNSTVTFSAIIVTSMAGYHFIVDDEYDVYRISSHTAGTDTATLDSVYTGDTNSSATFKLVKVEYELGSNDIIRLISPINAYRTTVNNNPNYKIYGIDEDRFDADFPLADIYSGTPDYFKVVKIADGNWTVVFNKYSKENLIKIEYNIIQLPSDLTSSSAATEILIPKEYRQVCCDWASSLLLTDKSDDKATNLLQKAQAGYSSMVMDSKNLYSDIDPSFGRMISREDEYNDGIRWLYR